MLISTPTLIRAGQYVIDVGRTRTHADLLRCVTPETMHMSNQPTMLANGLVCAHTIHSMSHTAPVLVIPQGTHQPASCTDLLYFCLQLVT